MFETIYIDYKLKLVQFDMIFINIDDNSILIPKHIQTDYLSYDLRVENTLTHKVVLYQGLVNTAAADALEYVFAINTLLLSNNSEYNYMLHKGKNIIETGLLRVGEFEAPEDTVYNDSNETIVYEG